MLIVNQFPVPHTQPDGSPGSANLEGNISRVHNVGVTFDTPPAELPAFTLAVNPAFLRAAGANPVFDPAKVTVTVTPVEGEPTRFKLTFSGEGAPGGVLKDGAYRLKMGATTIGTFNACYGAREETVLVKRVVVDQQQITAFVAAFAGDAEYDPQFDFDLDGQIKVTDLSEFVGRAGTYWPKK